MELDALVVQLAVVSVLSVTALLWRRHTTLNGGAIVGAILGAYLIWTLGGWQWLLVPLIVFMSYTTLLPKTSLDTKRLINLMAIASVASAGLFWLFLYRFTGRAELFYPFTIAFAAHLPLIGMVRHTVAAPKVSVARLLMVNIAKGWLVLAVAYLVADHLTLAFVAHTLLGLLGIAVAAAAFYLTQPNLANFPRDTARWRREALCAGAGSLAGLVPVLLAGLL
jgi:phytol kinase